MTTRYRGTPVSEGVAAGELYLPDVAAGTGAGTAAVPGGDAVTVTAGDVRAAFASVAAERSALADRLRAAGRDHEADIVQIGALMAADPALSVPALDALAASGDPVAAATREARARARRSLAYPLAAAAAAVTAAAETQAEILAALPDPDLAQRASDVGQVATAVSARLAGDAGAPPPAWAAFILVPLTSTRRPDPPRRRGHLPAPLGRRRRQLARGDHRPRPRPADAGGADPAVLPRLPGSRGPRRGQR